MKLKVLVTAPYFQPVIEKYRSVFVSHNIETIMPQVKQRLTEKELLGSGYLEEIDGILCGDDQITGPVLEKARCLKVISKWGTGIDSIDAEAAARRGIPVRNTSNAFTDPVADTVLAHVLYFARQISRLNEEMKQGIWQRRLTLSLKECVLGVVGIGNIGKAVVKRARSFGGRVLGNDIKEIPADFTRETGLESVPLDRLLRESDFVSLNCNLNPTSRHLINKEAIALMKPTAYLINTSRGGVVDENALIEALLSRKIAGAGLDVFEDEPLSCDSPFAKMPNVVLSPHNANASPVSWERVHKNTVDNLIGELLRRQN